MPHPLCITNLDPAAALPSAEIRIHGAHLASANRVPEVRIGGLAAPVLVALDHLVVARVPEASVTGPVEVGRAGGEGGLCQAPQILEVAMLIAENLHPVCNPALDPEGNIYVTLSGARGQKTPVSLFKLDANYALKAWSSAVINPSGLAFDRAGVLYVSSRQEGAIYRMAANGAATLVAEGLGVATGMAFDRAGDLYVGDRSGTIFKINADRITFVFATLEPSVAAYHLAFGPDRYLYVTGPSTSSFDTVWRVSPDGRVEPFFRGLGRPQGLAFDQNGCLYIAASYRGRRGVVRLSPGGQAECVVSGNNLVGLAFAAGRHGGPGRPGLVLATHTALYYLPWSTSGLSLF